MTILKIFILVITVVHATYDSDQANEIPQDLNRIAPHPKATSHSKVPTHHRVPGHPQRYSSPRQQQHPTHSAESETVIENKNVNIVVNVDPKDVAEELWRIIESRNPSSRRSPASRKVIKDLENAVKPVVSPTRRSQTSAYELANSLDHITRRALRSDPSGRSAIEEEMVTRDIVARMMKTLNNVKESDKDPGVGAENFDRYTKTRRMLTPVKRARFDRNNDDEGNVNLLITISKRKLREALL